jgi:hypothetical protein
MRVIVPLIKVPHHSDPLSIRGPYGKVRSLGTVNGQQVSAKLVMEPKMTPLFEQIDIIVGKE